MPFSSTGDNPAKLTLAPITLSHALWAKPDNRLGVTCLPSLSRNSIQSTAKIIYGKAGTVITLFPEVSGAS